MARDHQAINLGQGFPNFDSPDKIKQLITKYLEDGKNQYAPMPGIPELRLRLANKLNDAYKTKLNEQNITITSGATQALYTAITAFVNPGDQVIIFEPAYDSYSPTIRLNGGIPIPIELSAPDFRVDWEQVKDLINDKTRMIIINTPHNPTGTILHQSDLEALQDITRDTNIIILSDEVYEHLIYDGHQHQSILRYPELAHRSLAVYSFGKTFHATGWKIGYIAGPNALMQEFRKLHQWTVFSVNSFIQYALTDFLDDPSHYLGLNKFYQAKRDLFRNAIADSKFRPLECSGTYFQLYSYESISSSDDITFTEELVIKHGITGIPVSAFYTNQKQEKVIRFCFAKTTDVLLKAADKINCI